MKAKSHIAAGILVMVILVALLIQYFPNSISFFLDKNYFSFGTLLAGFICYHLGLILPDADTNDRKSRIFYSKFAVIGYFSRFLEFFIAPILGRKRGHRESMHTFAGITISSMVVGIIFTMILVAFDSYSAFTIPFIFCMTLFGQFVHLICDWHFHLF